MVNYLVLVSVLGLTAMAVMYCIGFGAPPPTVAEVLRDTDKAGRS